jgi:hypothetical protein
LPLPINELDEDFLDIFFRFANTYTEDSILHGYIDEESKKLKAVDDDVLAELGYNDRDKLSG